MKYDIIILEDGKFVNSPDIFTDEITDRRKKIQFALIKSDQDISIENAGTIYNGKIINGLLLLGSPERLPVMIEEVQKINSVLSGDEKVAFEWLENGEVGSSSLALCAAIYPALKEIHFELKDQSNTATPADGADIRRCIKFLNSVPNARAISPMWNLLIDNWSKFESLAESDNYKEMRQIIESCREQSSQLKTGMKIN